MKFEIPEHKLPELKKWLEEQDQIAAESMKEFHKKYGDDDEIHGYPPTATGECVEYIFMPTNLGPVIKARHLWTMDEIDLSDEI